MVVAHLWATYVDGKDITKRKLALVCQYFRSLFYDKNTATRKQRKFCKYTGLRRVVGGWNGGHNDDSLELLLCVSVVDPQFFVVLQLYFCPTNILSLCIVETLCVPKSSAFKPKTRPEILNITAHAKGQVREPKWMNFWKKSRMGGSFSIQKYILQIYDQNTGL